MTSSHAFGRRKENAVGNFQQLSSSFVQLLTCKDSGFAVPHKLSRNTRNAYDIKLQVLPIFMYRIFFMHSERSLLQIRLKKRPKKNLEQDEDYKPNKYKLPNKKVDKQSRFFISKNKKGKKKGRKQRRRKGRKKRDE